MIRITAFCIWEAKAAGFNLMQRLMSVIGKLERQMELIVGCRNSRELQSLEQFLDRFEVISLDENISDIAVDLLKQYRLSHGLLIADDLIASTAIALNCRFVLKIQRDYRFIDGLQLQPYPVA